MNKKQKQAKIARTMREFKSGKLTSGGKPVSNYKQAVAIALSQAGMSLPKKSGSGGQYIITLHSDQ